jgi:glycosyltransferase involved in cell wall biosynthesis
VRIAVYHNLPSGGAKRTLYETMRRLSRRHHVDVYSLNTADHSFCDVRPFARRTRTFAYRPSVLFSSPFGRLNQLQRWRDLDRLAVLQSQIAAEIDRHGYDVVFAEPCKWTQAPLILANLRTPSVYYCHEPPRALYDASVRQHSSNHRWRPWLDERDPMIALYRSAARRLDWRATRSADLVLVNSQYMRRIVTEVYGIQPVVCYAGVDTDVFRPLPQVARGDYVLSVGAIQPEKGFDFLIDCLGLVPKSLRPRLRLVGNVASARERSWLESLAVRRGVELRIEVGIGVDELVRRYNEALIVAYAPHNEPFGLVALEAMACETPVVGVAEGGLCETISERATGLLVRRERSAFAAAIEGLLSNGHQRAAYAATGRQYVLRNWTWDAAVERVEEHLQTASRQDTRIKQGVR